MKLRSLLLAGAAMLWAATALAQNPSPRVMVIVGETVDGQSATSSTVETELTQRLINAGYQLVERYETAGSRSEISLDKLLKGDVSGIKLSSTNVDFLVVGKVDLACECNNMPYDLGSKAKDTYKGRMDLRIITVDSGRVVGSSSPSLSTAKGASGTAKALVEDSWKGVEKSLSAATGARAILELRVSGLRDVTQADNLAASLGKIPGVAGATVRSVDGDATIYDIAAPKLDVASLTAPLSAQGLTIVKRSSNVIEARFDEAKAGRRFLAIAGFKNSTGKPAYDWISNTLPSIVETELTNSNYLVPLPVASRTVIDPEKLDAKALGAIAKDAQVVLTGSAELVGGKLRLSYRLYETNGSPLAAVQIMGDPEAAADLAQGLAWQADAQLYKKLVGNSNLASYASPFAKYATPASGTPTAVAGNKTTPQYATVPTASVKGAAKLRVNDIIMEDIFPAKLASYIDHPMGKLVVENPGSAQIQDIKVQIAIEGLLTSAQTIEAAPIAAGGKGEISLPLLLEREKALAIKERRPARVDINISYVSGGATVQDTFTKSIMIEGHTAIDWRDPDSIASFVTPENEDIVAFSRAALSSKSAAAVPSNVPRALFAPMVIFNAISSVGTKYQSDPLTPYGESPIDRVTMPQNMLSELRGDCDDLATLYASLLYAAGVRARLVTTPGHIFVAVDSGLPASSGPILELDSEHTVAAWSGKAYIPVEITKLDKGFLVAWKEGSQELARYASDPKQVQTIDLEAAWKLYPPFPGGSAKSAKLPPEDKLSALLTTDAKGFEAPVASNISDPKQALEAGVKAAIRKDVTAAKALFESAVADKANKAKATINLGNLDVVNKDYEAAEKHYNEAIKAGTPTEDELAYTNLGIALYMKGDTKKASQAFKKAKSSEAANIAVKLGVEKAPEEKPAKAPKAPKGAPEPKLTAVTSKGTTVPLKATPVKKVKSDSSAVSLGLRGAAADSIDASEYVRWAK